MRAVEISKPGGPEVLKPVERPKPAPKDGEILIKVAATGVNRPDIAQRAGLYPPPPGASDLPGLEAAGTVAALGAGVSGWKVGDAVCALTPGGSYAEYCTAPAPQCLPPPKGFDMLHAAALPENYFTVWHNLFERGQLKAGESVLIHGGASGIGTTAIQLAKAFGATVFTTVRNEQKAKAVRGLGADHAILYKDNDWAAEVKKLSGGVDVVLDMVAGDYLPKNLQLLNEDGRCVVIAVQLGATATISAVLHHGFGFLWTGFYRVVSPTLLRVGPYQGTVGAGGSAGALFARLPRPGRPPPPMVFLARWPLALRATRLTIPPRRSTWISITVRWRTF
jgi:NADPH2:quinone reductase